MNTEAREAVLNGLRKLFDEALAVAGLLIGEGNALPRDPHVFEGEFGRHGEGAAVRERLLTVKEAAAFLGVTPRCIYEWDKQGKIPTRRVNGELRFLREELLAMTEASSGNK